MTDIFTSVHCNDELTYTNDCLHAMANRLLTADAILVSSEQSHNVLTAIWRPVLLDIYENWIVVAVTPEKNVAIVVIMRYFEVMRSLAAIILGIPENTGSASFKRLPAFSYHFQQS